ncbi:hypothetical protein ACP4OV_022793 [Aristida adscensionis]
MRLATPSPSTASRRPRSSPSTGTGRDSNKFEAAGFHWRLCYYPRGDRDSAADDNISLYLKLADGGGRTPVAEVSFAVLDGDGNPVPGYGRSPEGPCGFGKSSSSSSKGHGVSEFISWSELEASGCLVDDRFAVRCDITVADDAAADLHRHLADLLWKKPGTADVAVDVFTGGGGHVRRARVAPGGAVAGLRGRAARRRRRRQGRHQVRRRPPPH